MSEEKENAEIIMLIDELEEQIASTLAGKKSRNKGQGSGWRWENGFWGNTGTVESPAALLGYRAAFHRA